jgi:hypothetical protein
MNKTRDVIEPSYINFLLRLNNILKTSKIEPSNIDEDIVHKTQQYEQETFYLEMYTGIEPDYSVQNNAIKKTLDSGSVWMR